MTEASAAAAAQADAVYIDGLTKAYAGKGKRDGKVALSDVSLRIPRGSFFGLLGPNGAGKSTLINIMAGLVVKSAGTVTICGYDLDTAEREVRQSIGVVPQELVLDSFFTVRQALDIHAGYYGVPKSRRQTQAIIEAMGLADKADARPRSLSGGMRRRLLIGKALVHAPPVLVLDEPTAGVDIELRLQLWAYVRELNRRGTTILLTTHYLEEAEALCDELAIINHGQVIACDSKAALMQKFDSKRLIVTTDPVLDELPPELAALGWEWMEDGRLFNRYTRRDTRIEALLDSLRAASLTIVDLSTKETELEEVFRHLTTC